MGMAMDMAMITATRTTASLARTRRTTIALTRRSALGSGRSQKHCLARPSFVAMTVALQRVWYLRCCQFDPRVGVPEAGARQQRSPATRHRGSQTGGQRPVFVARLKLEARAAFGRATFSQTATSHVATLCLGVGQRVLHLR